MYGTVARIRVRPENQKALQDIFSRQDYGKVDGFDHSMVLFEDDGMDGWLIAAFRDKEAYDRNAQDPAQDARYKEFRSLMEADPEWHDGPMRMFGPGIESVTELGLEDGSGFARGVKDEDVV